MWPLRQLMIIKILSKPIIQYQKQKSTRLVLIIATKQENPQEDNWWLNELESLGVRVKVINDLNDIRETSNLAENLKQILYQAYKEAFND